MQRRQFLHLLLAAPLAALTAATACARTDAAAALTALQTRSGGRLGVAALDGGNGRRVAFNADARFPLCSTWKLLAVAMLLARARHGVLDLERSVHYTPDDLVSWSPVTTAHLARGMSLRELARAAIEQSDNSAGNLLLRTLGGPAALTAWLRTQGDAHTRLDRHETALNEAVPGDLRDTTTPTAYLHDLQGILLGDALDSAARAQLQRWMQASTTGLALLRAGMPPHWQGGDKSGAGGHGTRNDVALLQPPQRAPLLISAFLTGSTLPAPQRDGVLAAVTRIVLPALA